MMDYQLGYPRTAFKDFERVMGLTYFDARDHRTLADLCYLCLHELSMHAEGNFNHRLADREALLDFCRKWGRMATQEERGIDYVAEACASFEAGNMRHDRPRLRPVSVVYQGGPAVALEHYFDESE